MKNSIIALISLLIITSCSKKEEAIQSDKPQFELLTPEVTGINFSNDLVSAYEFNVYKYRNFYNGGGVSKGDAALAVDHDSKRLAVKKTEPHNRIL